MKKGEKNIVWKGFFVNMLGVILAIVLTFGVNALWEKRGDKKRTKEMLILVRNELETNKEWFKNQEKYMRKDSYVYKKILEAKGDWKAVPKDTLRVYHSQTLNLGFSQLTASAWQIYQNSEMIQKMTDKELVIRLTDCYFWINEIKELIKTQYWDNKIKAIAAEVELYKYFDALMNNKETIFFYTLMSSDGYTIWDIFPLIDAIIDYTILLLDKHGDYRYDMHEKDKEIESFIEARIDSVRNSRMDSLLLKKDTIQIKSENQ